MTLISAPSFFNALGNANETSANPPVFAKGTDSDVMNNTFMAFHSPFLKCCVFLYYKRCIDISHQDFFIFYCNVLVSNDTIYINSFSDDRSLHNDRISYNCAFFNMNFSKNDRIFNCTFYN